MYIPMCFIVDDSGVIDLSEFLAYMARKLNAPDIKGQAAALFKVKPV